MDNAILLLTFHRTNPRSASSIAEVRRQLAEADQREAQQGSTPHEVPASMFVRNGLEIEDKQ